MKKYLLIILTALSVNNVCGQTLFTTVDSKLSIAKGNASTEVICSNPSMLVDFHLKRTAVVMQQNNFFKIDSQIIQITPLKFTGFKSGKILNLDDQKQLLDVYSKYELDYFKNELKIQMINSSHQWVMTKLRGWFIWYFKVVNTPLDVEKKMQIQLFASTIVSDKILTINALFR
jgi:hypothetical protein